VTGGVGAGVEGAAPGVAAGDVAAGDVGSGLECVGTALIEAILG
jgi:hypothetical protein